MNGDHARFARRLLIPPMVLCALALMVLAGNANVAILLGLRADLPLLGNGIWSGLTLLGDALVTPLLILPFIHQRPRLCWEGTLAALAATVFTHVLKPLVAMPRPAAVLEGLPVIGPRLLAGAFPSGHTASAFTLAGLLVLTGLVRGRLAVGLVFLLAALVGLSRIMVGAHWPADVLAGAAGGWACAGIGLLLARRWPAGAGPRALLIQQLLLALVACVDLFGHDTGYPAGIWMQHSIALIALGLLAVRAREYSSAR